MDKIRIVGKIKDHKTSGNITFVSIEDATGLVDITFLKKYGEEQSELL